ncbi:hypothetical protein LU604_01270 [Erwinia tracheiphila]|nr:hypothetical protein [Erwinia tracheiphila]UIA83787.1 hypothetical protein LU604_01270 [Erwinia tracheiphila]UIA92370.1 hypothetical protein LU632_01265 [Erwinia tracheiphila]
MLNACIGVIAHLANSVFHLHQAAGLLANVTGLLSREVNTGGVLCL